MLGKNKDNQFVTKKDLEETLEKTLDKALASQSKVILEAVDYGFNKVKNDLVKVKNDLSELKDGHEAIELRLGNLAPQFEVNDLKERVGKLELAREL
ncbi:hypothetical protein KKG85_00040 [Patescibacteria group bacterium]|nr:hypothetical protein [Patescibacteria group bacterium]MBU2580029.1 hypothetical protein [Patescibacteria group bacterium]